MTEQKERLLSHQIDAGVRASVTQAIEEHRKLGHSISIWHNGRVITLTAEQIPQIQDEITIEQEHSGV